MTLQYVFQGTIITEWCGDKREPGIFQWDYIEGAVGLHGDLTKHCRNQTPLLTKLTNERKQSVLYVLLNYVSLQKKKKKSICHQMNHDDICAASYTAHIIAS